MSQPFLLMKGNNALKSRREHQGSRRYIDHDEEVFSLLHGHRRSIGWEWQFYQFAFSSRRRRNLFCILAVLCSATRRALGGVKTSIRTLNNRAIQSIMC